MAPARGKFSCFNRRAHPRGHFYGCNDLYTAGIWIGYLSPDKHGQSFKGLPSFNQLKKNCKKFSPPFPPSIVGVAGNERYAVCRGCFGDESQLITLREIHFVSKTKLVVMPLDGTDDEGMFCILVPQPNDRSLQGVQAFRPYEYTNGGQDNTYTSNIEFLTLRNSSQASGTLEAVRAVLKPSECAGKGASDVPPVSPVKAASQRVQNISSLGELVADADWKDLPHIGAPKKRKLSNDGSENELPSKRRVTGTPVTRTQQPTPGSRDTTEAPRSTDRDPSARELLPGQGTSAAVEHTGPQARSRDSKLPSYPTDVKVIPLDLTEEQSKRVRLIWVVTADGTEYKFGCTLLKCDTFADCLDSLRKDAADDPEVIAILERTTVWRMTYQTPNAPKKAFTVRCGDDTGFELLQLSLAQSPFWGDGHNSKLDVELRALR